MLRSAGLNDPNETILLPSYYVHAIERCTVGGEDHLLTTEIKAQGRPEKAAAAEQGFVYGRRLVLLLVP